MKKISYTPEALNDLQRVIDFIEQYNPTSAGHIALTIKSGVDKLKHFPMIGLPVQKSQDPEKIRDIYVEQYTIRYLVTTLDIIILRVWHNKENENNLDITSP